MTSRSPVVCSQSRAGPILADHPGLCLVGTKHLPGKTLKGTEYVRTCSYNKYRVLLFVTYLGKIARPNKPLKSQFCIHFKRSRAERKKL